MGREVSSFGHVAGSPAAVSAPSAGTPDSVQGHPASPEVGFIRNPKSHRNKGHCEGETLPANVIMVEPQTRAELERALADFAKRKIALLAISGGDGTIRDVLTRGSPLFGNEWPALIILPQGKTNALALDLGATRQWTLNQALEAFRGGRIIKRRPLLVEQIDGDQRTRFGFLFGAGVFNAAIDAGQVAHRHGAFQGFAVGMAAAFGIMQAIFGFGQSPWRRLSKMRISTGDGEAPLPHSGVCPEDQRFLVGFTTLRKFPLGVRPFAGLVDDATIRYFILDAPLRRIAVLFPAAAMGWQNRVLKKLGMHRGSGEEFRIELEGDFILDGERFPPGTYRVSPGPEMRFVEP